jgi:hypothetical protein
MKGTADEYRDIVDYRRAVRLDEHLERIRARRLGRWLHWALEGLGL